MKSIGKFSIVIWLCILQIGCTSYKDMDDLLYLTAMIIDIDEQENIVLYMEVLHSYRNKSENKEAGMRMLLEGRGKTFYEAKQDLNTSASFEINGTQNKAIIFSEKAARKGISKYLDILVRNQQLLLKPYIVIYKEDLEELLTNRVPQEEYIGLYLEESFRSMVSLEVMNAKKLYQYMNQRSIGNNTEVFPILSIESGVKPEYKIENGAVFNNDRMVEQLTQEEYKAFNIMSGTGETGVVSVLLEPIQDDYVTFEILKNDVQCKINYAGNENSVIECKYVYNFRLTFAESQGSIDLMSEETRKKLVELFKQKIKKETKGLFQEYKTKNIDIFNIKEKFKRRYPQYEVENVLEISTLDVQVNVHLEGTSDTQSYKVYK